MRLQWKSAVTIAALTLSVGIAAPAWSELADPLGENYTAHVVPFYKIDSNWSAFLVIADTSQGELSSKGSPIHMKFYDSACNYKQDAVVEVTKNDAQFFALHDPSDANGQFNGVPSEGVILLDGDGEDFLTYVLLVNGNNNSLIRLDSIPCQGECDRNTSGGKGTWLRYDSNNTVAATFGDSGDFRTNLYFFSAKGDLKTELNYYGYPLHREWASQVHLDGYCDEIYLGSRRIDLKCTERRSLSSLNYTLLNTFPNESCAGKPGHIVTWATPNGTDKEAKDYSGFQETIASLVPPTNIIGTGYFHHFGEEEVEVTP
jgi:hypothetical protein